MLLYILSALSGLIKMMFYKIIYLEKLKFHPYSNFSRKITIRINNGSIKFGKHCSIRNNVYLSADKNAKLFIGDYSGFNCNCIVVAHSEINIGNNVLIGPNTLIYDHDHRFDDSDKIRSQGYVCKPVRIDNNVWIGGNVSILKGVHIGEGSIIAAGTVVTKDIPPNSIVYSDTKSIVKSRKFKN